MNKVVPTSATPPAIKVFSMNDHEWTAGACTPEEMLAWYMDQTGVSREEATGEEDGIPEELSPEAMQELTFVCDDGSRHSFVEELRLMVERGDKFPCFFASTEY
ncbi:MAG TPA: hypothetical protein VFA75_00420 [Nevskia sp.]|nr:hypothetical protein [Nevskia sp.]